MGQAINTGSVTASIPGSVTFQQGIPVGATIVVRDGASNAANVDLYTVTAGKTLYILSAWVCMTTGVGASNQGVFVDADVLGDGNYRKLIGCAETGTASYPGVGNNAVSFPLAISVPATKKVRLTGNLASIQNFGGFAGYEV